MAFDLDRRTFIAGAAGTALATGTQDAANAQAGPRRNITARIDRELSNLDPAYRVGPWEGNIIRSVFQRLQKQRPNSADLENDAAAEVTQTSPTMVDFRLKPGQMFSDGFGEMTAEDVKFSFERIINTPAGARESPYKGDWVGLERVEVTGQYTGRIVLSRPRANLFPIAIGDVSGCIVSKRAVEQRGAEHATRPVGSGPFQAVNFEAQRGVTLRRHAGYAGGGQVAFDEIAVRVITDPRTADLALRSGEVDFAVLSPSGAEPLRSVQGLSVTESPSIAYVWLGMNMEKPPLNDVRVRQAIRLALDVDQMLLAGYDGKAPRLNTLLPPQIFGHWSEAPVYRRNVAEARRLLQEARAANTTLAASGVRLKLLILNQPAYQNMALVARALLQEVGITLEVDAQPGATYWTAGQGEGARNLDMFILRFNGKHDPNFIMQWFVSSQIGQWNWQRWSNPEYDRLFEASATELDVDRRRQMVVDAQRLMDQTSAFVWLTNEINMLVHRSWLRPAGVPGWIDWQYDAFSAGA